MKPNINEQCAAMLGWKAFDATGGPAWKTGWEGQAYDVFGPADQKPAVLQKDFTPATNRDHLQMCMESVTLDQFCDFLRRAEVEWNEQTTDKRPCFHPLLLPTLTLATLLVQAWEETK